MKPAFAFEQAVLQTIRDHAAIGAGERVLVAVSGGADSTALLAVLAALRERGALPIELAVGHLNHHMRGAASDHDAAAVRALAGRFAVPCFVGGEAGLATVTADREAQARAARYAFLRRAARDWGAARIAVAHTRDDQAETVLLRLARGAGPASLGAMRVRRADGVVRPLLEQARAACIAYLEARALAWVEDASNADESYFRNRVRRRLLPLLEAELGVDVRQRLARAATQLREESALAEQRIADLLQDVPAGASLDLGVLRAAAEGAPRLLHAWLARASVRASERQIAALVRVADGRQPAATLDLGGGVRVVRCYDRLDLARATSPERAPVGRETPLSIPGVARTAGWFVSAEPVSTAPPESAAGGATCALLDPGQLAAPLQVRPAAPGDRVRLPYGRRKLADILIDAKVPRQERKTLAVVSSGDEIVWVPGVVRSVVARPTSDTRRLALLQARRLSGSVS